MVVLSGILRSSKTFRSSFRIPDKTKLRWYPGHMDRGMKVMQQKLKDVDCIIEVHDARIPFSGRNPNFQDRLTALRPHILVLNKVDLTDEHLLGQTVDALKSQSISEIIYTNCRDHRCKGVIELHKTIERVICSSNRYNRNENVDLNVMIIGVPNVGKSSVINSLRNRFLKKPKAASVGGIAGITRAVGSKIKVCENPLIYVYDTPGILTPNVSNIEVGMKLALCSTFKDREVGLVNIADYLLYWLNKHKHFSYCSYLNLKEPTDNIIEALTVSAVSYNMVSKIKEFGGSGGYTFKPDFDAAAYNFIAAFRKGTYGLFNLDSDLL